MSSSIEVSTTGRRRGGRRGAVTISRSSVPTVSIRQVPKPPVLRRQNARRRGALPDLHVDRGNRRGRFGLREYLKGLADPFFGPVGKLGFGTFVPTSVHTGWANAGFPVPATATCFGAVFVPSLRTDAIRFHQNSDPTLAIAGPFSTAPLANAATLGSQIQEGRVVTAGFRLRVRYPATAIVGNIGGIFLPSEAVSNLQGLSYNQIRQLAGYREFHPVAGGEIGGMVAYRPLDSFSFTFTGAVTTNTPLPTADANPILVVIGTGMAPNTFMVDYTAFLAVEGIGGIDAAGDETNTSSDLNIDNIGRSLPSLAPPVTTSLGILDVLDHAMSNVARARNGTGLMGMRGRMLDPPPTPYLPPQFPGALPSSAASAVDPRSIRNNYGEETSADYVSVRRFLP